MSMYNSCFSEPKRSHAVPGDDQAAPAPVVDPDEDEQWGQWTGDLTNWGRRAFFADRLKMNARISIYLDRYCR